MQGKVSMVVPCYNKEDYISAMLDSVLAQVWDNIELILVNDGSTDRTREIIGEYEPKLRERGYEVVIIDQENAGCCAAVYAGLTRMTGDYFCLVDCDDEIMTEYVSRMAGWLDEHDDYEWTACEYFVSMAGEDGNIVRYEVKFPVPQDTPKLLENYLLWRVTCMSWIYMMRTSYMKKCGLIDFFCSERRATYEPCMAIPPAAAGGKLKFFAEPLYVYNKHASDLSGFPSFKKLVEYQDDYYYLIEKMLNRLNISDADMHRYLSEAQFAYLCRQVEYLRLPGGEENKYRIAAEISELLDRIFTPSPKISADEILNIGFDHLLRMVKEKILELDEDTGEKFRKAHRIIGYGALGKRGKRFMPTLTGTMFCPTVIWDKSADDSGKTAYGIPVTSPDFESITEEDAVIVFPGGEVLENLISIFKDAGIVLSGRNLSDLSSSLLYPSFAECKCAL